MSFFKLLIQTKKNNSEKIKMMFIIYNNNSSYYLLQINESRANAKKKCRSLKFNHAATQLQ